MPGWDWGGAFLADLHTNWKGRVRRLRIHLFAFGLFLLGLVQAIDPYVLQSLFPERWGAAVFVGLGVIAWTLRKALDHPVLVSTTFHEEAVTDPTEPHGAPRPDDADLHRLADDGGPRAAEDFGHAGPDDRVL